MQTAPSHRRLAPARSPVARQNGGGGGARASGGTTMEAMQIAGGDGAGPALSRRKGHSPAALLGGMDLITDFLIVLFTENQ